MVSPYATLPEVLNLPKNSGKCGSRATSFTLNKVIDALIERPRWRRLHELLTAGNVVIRVVSCDNAPFRHGNCDHARQDIMMRRGAQCLVQLSNRQMDIDSCVLAYIYIRSNSCNAVTE